MSHYTYFFILIISLSGPLLLSFDRKVHFYKKWQFVFPAMIPAALIYIVWDSYFTKHGIWNFNSGYIAGLQLFELPIEEILFFFVVPYCCLFIYECIRVYFPKIECTRKSDILLGAIAVVLLGLGLAYPGKAYTASTFLFTSLFIAVILCFRSWFRDFNSAAFLVAYAVILIPFLIVNGFLTAMPVVLYNDAENLGIRIYTIPVEDVFYGMLLVMMNVAVYEKLRNRHKKNPIKNNAS
jgi:lycopene cyclase domain-containing protein